MKRLQLKESDEPKAQKKTVPNTILSRAREQLKTFVHQEVIFIYQAVFGKSPNFAEDEEWSICTGDLCEDVYVDVLIHENVSTNQKTYERIEISEIRETLDGSVFFVNENGDEWDSNEISLEDIANVGDILYYTYYNLTHPSK